jgi:hypothetical protein
MLNNYNRNFYDKNKKLSNILKNQNKNEKNIDINGLILINKSRNIENKKCKKIKIERKENKDNNISYFENIDEAIKEKLSKKGEIYMEKTMNIKIDNKDNNISINDKNNYTNKKEKKNTNDKDKNKNDEAAKINNPENQNDNDNLNLINNNNLLINDDINLIKNDISYLKNEVQLLKSAKINMCGDMGKILKEIEFVNQKFEKTLKDINNSKIEIQTKLTNFESTNRLFEENFSNLKEEFLQHLDQISSQKNEDINKISEQVFGQIKQMKTDMDKFNLNIIQENQKFIDYSQGQLQEHDNNMKKLFEFTSDDIEVLKKKSDTLENLLKNTRNEMINNINSVEGFLTNRYDSIFKSISSDRNNNQF